MALIGTAAANACVVGTLATPTLAASGIASLSATYNNQSSSPCGATARFTATWSGGAVTIHNAALSTSISKALLTVRTTLAASEVQAHVGESLTIGLQLGNYTTSKLGQLWTPVATFTPTAAHTWMRPSVPAPQATHPVTDPQTVLTLSTTFARDTTMQLQYSFGFNGQQGATVTAGATTPVTLSQDLSAAPGTSAIPSVSVTDGLSATPQVVSGSVASTLEAPVVSNVHVVDGSVGEDQATVGFTLNRGASATTASGHVSYGTTSLTAQTADATVSIAGDQAVQVLLTGLEPNTDYTFEVDATNSNGPFVVQSAGFTLHTLPLVPTPLTGSFSGVTGSTATVVGSVDAHGTPATSWFEYGETTAYGAETSHEPVPDGAGPIAVAATLTGLTPGAAYHYRLGSTNSRGQVVHGLDATFTTTVATLDVTIDGAGTGHVTGSPVALDCVATCSGSFPVGTSITLTAVPTGGAVFDGWSGACVNAVGTCVVSMAAATVVTATFSPPVIVLTRAALVVSFKQSVAKGSLVMAGSAGATTDVTVFVDPVASAGGLHHLLTLVFTVNAGPFTRSRALPRAFLSGTYRIVVKSVSGARAFPDQESDFTVAGPREGIVDKASISRSIRGAAATTLRAGTKRIVARFHFAVAPRSATTVRVTFLAPRFKQTASLAAPVTGQTLAPQISSNVALPSGAWTVTLKVGSRIVRVLRFTIR